MSETGKTKPGKQSRLRLLSYRLLLIAASLVVALLLVEVGLRIAIANARWQNVEILVPRAELYQQIGPDWLSMV